jgi:ferrous iron transport protein A
MNQGTIFTMNIQKQLTLKDIKVGKTVEVLRVTDEGAFGRRIMDMGITKGVHIHVRKVAPMGDPIELKVRSYNLTLRRKDAEIIEVKLLDDSSESNTISDQNRGGAA